MEIRSPLSELQPRPNGFANNSSMNMKDPSSLPDIDNITTYKNLLAKGRACAAEGALQDALSAYKHANKIKPTDKIAQRIKKIEDVLKELEDDPGNEDFVELDNGLIIYRELVERLFPHQIEGIKWMFDLQKNKKKGGILADDMGLGKTIQVISVLSAMFDMELIRHVLLVLPLSLIPNWEREFEKWAPGIKTKQFYGAVRERDKALEYCQRKPSVCLTTYGLVQTKWEQLGQTRLRKEFVWDYIILDEGHKIKNPTKTTKGLHAIPSRNRLIMTGTPIQNNLRELWALFDWVMQGTLLGTQKTFKTEYENPIIKARQRGASAGEIHLGNYMAESLRKIVDPYILRRTKGSVSAPKPGMSRVDKNQEAVGLNNQPSFPKLEKKNDFVIWTYLSSIQEEIYRDFLAQDSVKELLASRRSPLVYLTILKKICDHPRLLPRRACHELGLEANDSFNKEDFHTEAGKECAANRIDNISDETLIAESGKIQFLLELLKKLRDEGHRTLIFSLSRKILNIIHRILNNNKFKVMRLDGTISKLSERELRVKKFQQDATYDVFLLTTQVGGVGLTLTAADRVVIFDPSWNPATDAQAVDRIYRIGQEKNVVVYRLITCGTVEEKIYRRQIFKDSIIKQSTGDNKDPYRYFTNHDLKELFEFDNARESLTQRQLSELHSEQRCLDPHVDEHLAFLHTLPMFGISDHDLMFTQEPDDIDNDMVEGHQTDIRSRVAAAKDRIEAEARQFTGTEEAEQRWGGFNVESKIKLSPPSVKENEPVFAIDGLYDKLNSLNVKDETIENIFNKSRITIPSDSESMGSESKPICISDSEDEHGQISAAASCKTEEPNPARDSILAYDSPARQNSNTHNSSDDMGQLEIEESFASDFDLDETTHGFTRISEGLKGADTSNCDNDELEASSSSDFAMDETTLGFTRIGKDLENETTVEENEEPIKKGLNDDAAPESNGAESSNEVGSIKREDYMACEEDEEIEEISRCDVPPSEMICEEKDEEKLVVDETSHPHEGARNSPDQDELSHEKSKIQTHSGEEKSQTDCNEFVCEDVPLIRKERHSTHEEKTQSLNEVNTRDEDAHVQDEVNASDEDEFPINDDIDPFEEDVSQFQGTSLRIEDEGSEISDHEDLLDENINIPSDEENNPGEMDIQEEDSDKLVISPMKENGDSTKESEEELASSLVHEIDEFMSKVQERKEKQDLESPNKINTTNENSLQNLSIHQELLKIQEKTSDDMQDEVSFGNFYFSGSSETSRSNTPGITEGTIPDKEADELEDGGFLRSTEEDSRSSSPQTMEDSREDNDHEQDEHLDEEEEVLSSDEDSLHEKSSMMSKFLVSSGEDESSQEEDEDVLSSSDEDVLSSDGDYPHEQSSMMNESLLSFNIDKPCEDSPWNSKDMKKRKLKRRSTALPQPLAISDESENEENEKDQYRVNNGLDSSADDVEQNGKMSSLMLSFDSENSS